MSPESRYCMGLQFLAERFNTFLAESNAYDHGILIADSRMKSLDFNVAVSYLSYIFGHETGRLLTRLVESPLFADSRLTAGLQITDNIAGPLFANHYHYYCRSIPGAPDYSHIPPRYWLRLDGLQFKSKRRYDGYIMHGFKLCDHRPETSGTPLMYSRTSPGRVNSNSATCSAITSPSKITRVAVTG